MEFWKKNKWKIIIPVLIVLVLAVAFVLGDRTPAGEKPGAETMQTQQPEAAAPAEPLPDSLESGAGDAGGTGAVRTGYGGAFGGGKL